VTGFATLDPGSGQSGTLVSLSALAKSLCVKHLAGSRSRHPSCSSNGCRHSTCHDVEHLQPEVNMSPRYQNRIELLQGTLDLLILQTLRWGPQHGYGIGQAIRTNSGDILQVDTGSLYPALHRLERQKWITADWKVSENKQRVRVYRLTARGKKQLESERSRWAQVSDAIAGVLNPAKRESEA
jgi:PadR family transcriptional regulator